MKSNTRSTTLANGAHTALRSSFVLTIWAEAQSDQSPVWRGYLEAASGDRRYFITLADLAELLQGNGWKDPSNPNAALERDSINVR